MRLPRRETHFCLNTLVGLTKKEEIRRENVSLTPTHSVKQSDRERERERESQREGERGREKHTRTGYGFSGAEVKRRRWENHKSSYRGCFD